MSMALGWRSDESKAAITCPEQLVAPSAIHFAVFYLLFIDINTSSARSPGFSTWFVFHSSRLSMVFLSAIHLAVYSPFWVDDTKCYDEHIKLVITSPFISIGV